MGVTATMTISLIENNRLWGMIACHHSSPKYVNYETRTICEFLAQVMSLELKAKEESQDLDYKKKLQSIQSQLVASISDLEDFQDCFVEENNNLLELVGASGAAICWQEEINAIGKTPDRSQILALLDWIDVKIKDDLIFDTDSLPKKYAAAEQFKDTASGLLVLAIAKFPRNYILWFRPEVIQTVNWGGNPNNPVEIEENGELKLSPRKSFALWQETVQLQSLPWKQWEIEAALELRSNIVNIIFRQADRLAKLNLELERSNNELDAFAYIASHDLKEPLRGIHNYSSFLIEDYADLMSGDGITKLQTLMDLTQRMEDLINSLLHYSRLGRTELKKQETDLNELLKNAIDTLSISAKVDAIEIEIPRPLPRMKCDRVLMREVFTNLITNAIKYNNKPQKWVEIGWQQLNNQIIFYVKDNGIGIRDKHQERIFAIFKRLHPTSKYGGGTGAGLTIVKKILERHDGRIWLESTYGEGSTFYFTWSN
jgi:light-regulated signal transduction histidine kinase (bacteriophytochrome)